MTEGFEKKTYPEDLSAKTSGNGKKIFYTNDQWANFFGSGYALTNPSNDVESSLIWETASNSFWYYDKGFWSMIGKDEIMRLIRKRILRVKQPFMMTKGDDIYKQLKFEVNNEFSLEDRWITFNDGVWNPDTDEFAEYAPWRFSTVKINVNFRELELPKPKSSFDLFLEGICVNELLQPNPAMRNLLQEMFGYYLTSSSGRAVSFFLSGEGRNGKGVISELLMAILGRGRVSNLSLNQLTASRFGTAGIVGKKLNIADETSTSREAVSDMFKALTSNGTVQIERKYGESFQYRPPCNYLYIVNGVSVFDSFGYSMRERIVAVPFFRRFEEHERDWTLEKRLVNEELQFIVAWAVAGLRRLKKNNYIFTKFTESEELLDSFEKMSDSLADYLSDWEPSEIPVPFYLFYSSFRTWIDENGRHKMSSKKVSLRLKGRNLLLPKKMWDRETKNSVLMVKLRRKLPESASEQNQGDLFLNQGKI